MRKYETMTPEDMYWFDEAFGRHSAQDSARDIPVLFNSDPMQALRVLQRSYQRINEADEISVIDAAKHYVQEQGYLSQGINEKDVQLWTRTCEFKPSEVLAGGKE